MKTYKKQKLGVFTCIIKIDNYFSVVQTKHEICKCYTDLIYFMGIERNVAITWCTIKLCFLFCLEEKYIIDALIFLYWTSI